MTELDKHNNENNLLASQVAQIIREARQTAYRAVNITMVLAYWNIGKLIVEDELHWERADYGKAVLRNLSQRLTKEFGKGFDESNLRYMRLFYKTFPICDTLRHELSWSHYRRLISVENSEARIQFGQRGNWTDRFRRCITTVCWQAKTSRSSFRKPRKS